MAKELETRDIDNFEIMRTGTWNGLPWSERDIDEVIRNFNAGVAKIPVKVTKTGTHESQALTLPGGAALGFVESLKRVGSTLVAHLTKVPKLVAELIAQKGGVGALPTPSVEGWPDFETADGEHHGRVLDGLIVFGVHLPAVHGLQGLAELYQDAVEQKGPRFACCADIRASGALPPSPAADASAVAAAPAKKDEKIENKKGQNKVDENKIELTREDHKKLVEESIRLSFVTSELAREKARADKAESDRVEMQKKVDESEKSLTEFRAEKARIECEKIGASVEEQVKAGRLEPGKKEAVIAYTLSLKAEERVAYLKTIEALPSLFGESAKVLAPAKASGNEFDDIHNKAIALQKATGMTYEAASEAVMSGAGA